MGKRLNSKSKGNRGELRIAKILTEKLGMGAFSRTPNSGGFSTSHVLSEEAKLCLSGDLIAPVPNFAFSIENKCGYDIDLSKILSNKPQIKQIGEFLEQACIDAEKTARTPMVIYTRDYREPLAIIPLNKKPDIDTSSFMVFTHEIEGFPLWDQWIVLVLEDLLDKSPREFFLVQKETIDRDQK